MNRWRSPWVWGGGAMLAAGVLLSVWRPRPEAMRTSTRLAEPSARPAGRQPAATAPATALPGGPADPAQAQAQAFAQWVAASSALRGTALDGDWGLDGAGQLQPTRALRQRFDHLLLLQGQAPLSALTAHLRWLAGQDDLTAAQADAVLQVWQRYLGLLQAPIRSVARPDQPDTVGPALAERQQLRRQWLGPAWAQAFYGEEEAALQAWMTRAAGAPAEPAPWIDRTALDPQALQRLAQEEAMQARWQQRLTQARTELARLQAAPELSEPQRAQAQSRWLAEQFSPAERVRVHAVLGLAGPP